MPWCFRCRLWHLRGKWGWVTLSGLVDHFFMHISTLCLIFYCNSFRIIPSLKLIYLLNIFLRWVCSTSTFFVDGELRPLKQGIYLKSSELVTSHSSFLMLQHLHGTTENPWHSKNITNTEPLKRPCTWTWWNSREVWFDLWRSRLSLCLSRAACPTL